jgi:hypothetical protein
MINFNGWLKLGVLAIHLVAIDSRAAAAGGRVEGGDG